VHKLWRNISSWAVNFAIAMTALRVNLMRSILTTLGVMIGVFAVILAIAVGEGAKLSVTAAISALGSNMAIIFPFPDADGARNTADEGRLTMRDAMAIERSMPGVTAIAPQLTANMQFSSAGRKATTSGLGITPGYGVASNVGTEQGRFITSSDVQSASRVVVVGQTVAEKLFGNLDPVGETVRINRMPFTVVGIMETKGSSFGRDNDDIALVPITTMRQRFATNAVAGPDDLHTLFVGFEDGVDLGLAKKEMKRILRERNRIPPGGISPFTIRTTEEFMRETAEITGIMQAILVSIASISLLVGGIGIMNIMLVSVTERTREIGLRMALGARRSDIRNQFLVEAAVLCMLGGGLGLGLAMAAAKAVAVYAEFPTPIGIGTILFAILFSAFIGLLFGGYPAVRASRLSPIEALRSE
jgi:putative ABC transport system permease protein